MVFLRLQQEGDFADEQARLVLQVCRSGTRRRENSTSRWQRGARRGAVLRAPARSRPARSGRRQAPRAARRRAPPTPTFAQLALGGVFFLFDVVRHASTRCTRTHTKQTHARTQTHTHARAQSDRSAAARRRRARSFRAPTTQSAAAAPKRQSSLSGAPRSRRRRRSACRIGSVSGSAGRRKSGWCWPKRATTVGRDRRRDRLCAPVARRRVVRTRPTRAPGWPVDRQRAVVRGVLPLRVHGPAVARRPAPSPTRFFGGRGVGALDLHYFGYISHRKARASDKTDERHLRVRGSIPLLGTKPD